MKPQPPQPPRITLVDPDERLGLAVEGSTIFYRRLSLGALAAIERQQARLVPDPRGGRPRAVVPAAALEAAICAQAVVGWQGVCDHQGRPVEFSPARVASLPAGVRSLVTAAARQTLHPSGGDR